MKKNNNKPAEVEKKVLGIFLIDHQAAKIYAPKLNDYFWTTKTNKKVYDAIHSALKDNVYPDVISVSERVPDLREYVFSLSAQVNSGRHIRMFVNLLLAINEETYVDRDQRDISPCDIMKRILELREEAFKNREKEEEERYKEYRIAHSIPVRVKKLHKDAKIPFYATEGSAGMDLTAVSKKVDEHGNIVYGTGLAFQLPVGTVGYIYCRSSNSKKDLRLTNCVGIIDSDYRGEVTLKFRPSGSCKITGVHDIYEVGDRIGQIIVMKYPNVKMFEVDELDPTERGEGGYGHTGK